MSVYAKLYNMTDNADLMLMDKNGNRIAYSKTPGAATEAFTMTLAPGTYYVRALHAGIAGTAYRLRFGGLDAAVTATPPGDNSLATARDLGVLSIGTVRVADDSVGPSDSVDYVRIQLQKTSAFSLKLLNLTDNADVDLLSASGAVIKSSARIGTTDEALSASLAAGTYYARVRFAGTKLTNYRLRVAAA